MEAPAERPAGQRLPGRRECFTDADARWPSEQASERASHFRTTVRRRRERCSTRIASGHSGGGGGRRRCRYDTGRGGGCHVNDAGSWTRSCASTARRNKWPWSGARVCREVCASCERVRACGALTSYVSRSVDCCVLAGGRDEHNSTGAANGRVAASGLALEVCVCARASAN